jgi:putative transcriptional regulator
MRPTIGDARAQENHKTMMHVSVIALGPCMPHLGRMDLAGKLLIAMPGMGDPRFAHTVILVCAHSPDGSMGLIVNRPAPDLSFAGLLDQIGIPKGKAGRDIRVLFGGPVGRGRGFVLHSPDYAGGQATIHVEGGYGMTATLDVLEAIARGEGPATALLALGYSGWGPGQLEAEIQRNDWLTADAPSDLVFSSDDTGKWTAALRRMGIDPITLSSTAGRA